MRLPCLLSPGHWYRSLPPLGVTAAVAVNAELVAEDLRLALAALEPVS